MGPRRYPSDIQVKSLVYVASAVHDTVLRLGVEECDGGFEHRM